MCINSDDGCHIATDLVYCVVCCMVVYVSMAGWGQKVADRSSDNFLNEIIFVYILVSLGCSIFP